MFPDSCCMRGVVLPHSFLGLMSTIIGANCLVSLLWDGDLKEHSQATDETLLASGRSHLLSPFSGTDCLFSLSVSRKKMCVSSSVQDDNL